MLQRLFGPLLAFDRERILLGSTDLVALGHHFRRLAERDRPLVPEPGVDEAPANCRIGDFRRPSAPAFSLLEHHVGRARHALDPARDERLAFTRLDRLSRTGDGLKPGAAQAIHRLAGDFHRKARQQERHAGDVAIVLACLVGAPEHDIGDTLPIQTGMTIEQLGDHVRRQIVGAHVGQAPAKAADRRTHAVDQIYRFHGQSRKVVIRPEL